MKKALLGLATCFVAASIPAQIDAGPFARTFSSTLTRGYYFQVPAKIAAMIVTHAVVPDEKRTAGNKQIVAIYRLKAAPPAWSATVAVTPVFYKDGVDPNTPIPVVDQSNNNAPLIYRSGEWFVMVGGSL